MKINRIFIIFSLIFLFASCLPNTKPNYIGGDSGGGDSGGGDSGGGDSGGGDSGGGDSGGGDSGGGDSGGGDNISKKIMYFEFKFDGEAIEDWTYVNFGGDKGLRDILFQIDGITKTYLFRAKVGMEGYNYRTMFTTSILGRDYDIPFFLGDELLKKEYLSSDSTVFLSPTIAFGMALSSSSDAMGGYGGIPRVQNTPFIALLKDFDEDLHTNVAMFNVHHYQVFSDLYKNYIVNYKITFLGFKNK